ncbi:hypothetical protein [Hoeflea sp.]|uniref:hypothetical protein n=1 Tax=Hoeflea sp. TaxID=1940281 RepID=UPI003B018D02
MTNYEKIRRYKQAAAQDAAERDYRSLNVFLAGPFIDIEKPATDPDNNGSNAKKLRYHLYSSLEAKGHVVYLGEDVEMRVNGTANFGKYANAVVYERHHLTNHNEAVIVLPDSPGSFCEIGDWASSPETCAGMLLLIDGTHEGKLNYINEGVVKFAKSNGADVQYIDYANHAAAAKACEDHLMSVIHRLQVEELYGRK